MALSVWTAACMASRLICVMEGPGFDGEEWLQAHGFAHYYALERPHEPCQLDIDGGGDQAVAASAQSGKTCHARGSHSNRRE
mmetsp:Transcript_19059/g.62946  ORF Transcript_19059/g.62946 Transcript_19059/m.62946 type:complete len:82 (-) Transcript_19059:529-774(-)